MKSLFTVCLFCFSFEPDVHFGEEEKEYLLFKQRKCRFEIVKDSVKDSLGLLHQEAQRCILTKRYQKNICNTKNVIGRIALYFKDSSCEVDYETFNLRCEVIREKVDFLCEKIEERYHNYREAIFIKK